MNHIARWQGPGYGANFIDTVISEGLAIIFAQENWKGFKAPWGEYNKNEVNQFVKYIKANINTKDKYDHQKWFFGKGEMKWLGYRIGSYIIQKLRDNNPEISLSKLTKMKSLDTFKLSGIDFKILL